MDDFAGKVKFVPMAQEMEKKKLWHKFRGESQMWEKAKITHFKYNPEISLMRSLIYLMIVLLTKRKIIQNLEFNS